jgi:hypothetical protein
MPTANPHFESPPGWTAARALLAFEPVAPSYTAGRALEALRVHVRDHRLRDIDPGDRSLEAHYGTFVLSQLRQTEADARRLALDVSYGRDPQPVSIAGHDARMYDLGPEPDPDDLDGRMPAVVAWHDGEMVYLLASSDLPPEELIRIAGSVYPR